MGWKRVVWYGLGYWIVGGLLTLVQFSGALSPVAGQSIFYGFVVLAPLLFGYPFFARMVGRPTWRSGVRLAVSWMVLFTVLDALVFLWWLEFPLRPYLSWQLALAYGVLVGSAVGIAHIVGQRRKQESPEGLE